MFLCCGDALFDLFVDQKVKDNHVALEGGVGGSPLNVAMGLARLGHKSRYFTAISKDLFGQRMRNHLDANGLDTSLCVDTDRNTTLAVIEKREDGSAQYVFYTSDTADAAMSQNDLPTTLPSDVAVLHVASYSTVLEITGATLHALVQRESANRAISFDPNLRLMVEPDIERWRSAFKAIGQCSFIIKASDEDVDALMGPGKYDEFLDQCLALGAQVAFVTLGADGALGADASGQRVKRPGIPIVVEDTVGAGDTFQAAALHYLASNDHIGPVENGKSPLKGSLNLERCMQFALSAAAITCTRKGPNLPSLNDVETALANLDTQ